MRLVIKIIQQLLVAAILIVYVSGCLAIDQWQREYLGDSIMNFDYDPEESNLNEHIYPRREGSSGGNRGAGGGCGC